MADWNIAEAKQKLSKLLRAACDEPQRILNRGRPVAAVVDVELYEAFMDWLDRRARRTMAEAFRELREIADDERYLIEVPPREDRPNELPEVLDELPG